MRVDGVILWGSGQNIKNPDMIPMVVITNQKTYSKNADAISIAYDEVIFKLTETIKEYGHKRVGFIGEALTVSKENMFKRAMRRTGLPICSNLILRSHMRFAQAGEDGMRRLIEESCDITVRLPIDPRVESLNVSTAAAVVLYELSK